MPLSHRLYLMRLGFAEIADGIVKIFTFGFVITNFVFFLMAKQKKKELYSKINE